MNREEMSELASEVEMCLNETYEQFGENLPIIDIRINPKDKDSLFEIYLSQAN